MELEFTDQERDAHEKIIDAMRAIQDLGLCYNQAELAVHIHGLQSFVSQHYLHRIKPDFYSDWFTPSVVDLEPKDEVSGEN